VSPATTRSRPSTAAARRHATGPSRPRRALLFCPATEPGKAEKAARLQVDGVILDLEDGVALGRKEEARREAARALSSLDFGRAERLVRVNPEEEGLEEDVRITGEARLPPDAYVLPKAESPEAIRRLSRLLSRIERRHRLPGRTIRILAIIETARGVVRLESIAASDPRMVALLFGAEDLCGDLGGVRMRDGRDMLYARSAVAIHAAARRLQAIDTPFVDLDDEAGLVAETRDALSLGYSGKLAIHPSQIAPIHGVFTPGPDEIRAAQRLLDEHQRHQSEGKGVFVMEGRMIDMPMVRAARAVLARARLTGIEPQS
jgi:citrate lyase beta subunit